MCVCACVCVFTNLSVFKYFPVYLTTSGSLQNLLIMVQYNISTTNTAINANILLLLLLSLSLIYIAIPGLHAVQETAPALDTYPWPHCTGFWSLFGHFDPAGHSRHCDAAVNKNTVCEELKQSTEIMSPWLVVSVCVNR